MFDDTMPSLNPSCFLENSLNISSYKIRWPVHARWNRLMYTTIHNENAKLFTTAIHPFVVLCS